MKNVTLKLSAVLLAILALGALIALCGKHAQAQAPAPAAPALPHGAFVEKLSNWNKYYSGPVWEKAFKALESVSPDAPDGKTPIQGEDIFMTISTYNTKPAESVNVESHRKYIDIQMVLKGSETFRWYPLASLTVKTPYDPAKDIMFYNVPEPLAEFNARPGFFAVFTPQDAHQPGLLGPGTTTPTPGRRAVVKIAVAVLQAAAK